MTARVPVPKLTLRGNRWCVRVQVPKHMQQALRRKEKWISLKTSDRGEAIRIAGHLVAEQRWLDERVYRMKCGLRYPIEKLAPDQLLTLGREAYETSLIDNTDYQKEFRDRKFKHWNQFVEAKSKELDHVIHEFKSSDGHHPYVEIMMLNLCESNQIEIPKDSQARNDLRQICVDAAIDAHRRRISRLSSQEIPANPDGRFVNQATGETRSYVPLERQLSEPPPPEPTLTELVDKFLKNPNKIRTDKTKKSARGFLSVAIEILGDTTAIADISLTDCEHVRDLLSGLPPNFSKLQALENRPIDEMVRIARQKGMKKLSPTGVNNYLLWLTVFLNWCRARGMIDRVPISYGELKIADPVRKEDKRFSFSDDQISTIFHSEVFAENQRKNSLFWVPLIALWNGMRSNEICQLDAADVRQVEGVWGFDITNISVIGGHDKRTKNDGSIRIIPIHNRLIEFGIIEFRNQRPDNAKLFGDITIGADGYYSTNFSKKSNRYLKKIGVHGPKHKFHSFRHTFRDALRLGRVDREIGKALGGWKTGNTDAFDIYGSGFPLEELAGELKRVDYPKVDWEHLLLS